MFRSLNFMILAMASLAIGCLFLAGTTTVQAAPVALNAPLVQSGGVVGAPAIHKIRGRIVSVAVPAGNVGPAITVAVQRRQAAGAAVVVVNKTFPIAPGAPIELIGNGATQPLTPAALQPGRQAALLLSQGVVSQIDLFAAPAATVGGNVNYDSYYAPGQSVWTSWFVGPQRLDRGWNNLGHWWGSAWNHSFVGTSHVGVVGHRGHVGHVKTGKTVVGHKTSGAHRAHKGHAGHPGHHGHAVKHPHVGGHHGGGHHGGGHHGGGHHK